jgi:hypothetical protein
LRVSSGLARRLIALTTLLGLLSLLLTLRAWLRACGCALRLILILILLICHLKILPFSCYT